MRPMVAMLVEGLKGIKRDLTEERRLRDDPSPAARKARLLTDTQLRCKHLSKSELSVEIRGRRVVMMLSCGLCGLDMKGDLEV